MNTPAVIFENDELKILDQVRLPGEMEYIQITSLNECISAIKDLKVRGAPAIGICAAYGLYVIARRIRHQSVEAFIKSMDDACRQLADSRPTAVNLSWAISRIRSLYHTKTSLAVQEIVELIKSEAIRIHMEDKLACEQIGYNGLAILSNPANILTHCNTGSLATGGWGTALGIIYAAHKEKYNIHVYVDETRPVGQGARLTFWELMQNHVPCTLITDSTAGLLMKDQKVDIVLFGADRIARNGDVANKVGSYSLAALARLHGIPCYAAAPTSSFDLSLDSGQQIEIELRNSQEILHIYGYNDNLLDVVNVFNPAFDVTPAEYLSGIVTEKGIIERPDATKVTDLIK